MNHSHFINRPENQCDESKKFNIDIVNDEIKDIFPTLFYDFELDIDNEAIVNECYDLQKKFPKGVEKSNVNGWQSDVYELFTIKNHITPSIQELAKFVIDISNDISKQNESNHVFSDEKTGWWININKGMSYNLYHSHPGCTFIALYYPKISKNLSPGCGDLTLIRSDPSVHNSMVASIAGSCEYTFLPKEKHLYMFPSTIAHYVTPHFDEEDRISIAFNIE